MQPDTETALKLEYIKLLQNIFQLCPSCICSTRPHAAAHSESAAGMHGNTLKKTDIVFWKGTISQNLPFQ